MGGSTGEGGAGGPNPPRPARRDPGAPVAPIGSAYFWSAPAEPTDPGQRARREAAQGAAFYRQRDYTAAVDCFRHAVELQPHVAEYHYRLAGAAEAAGRESLVERHAREAIRLAPDQPAPHYLLSKWLYRTGSLDDALAHSAKAVELGPNEPAYAVLRGSLFLSAGRTAEAWDAIKSAVESGSDDRWLAHLYSRIAPSIGHAEPALAVVERALRAPGLTPDPSGGPMLHFAASGLLERLGRYDAAFEHARQANTILRRGDPRHDPRNHSAWVSEMVAYFTKERLDGLPRASHGDRRALFIVGMPRSGTTLVEQILASHPLVAAGGEMQAMRLAARATSNADWANGLTYPRCLDGMSLDAANRLAAKYLATLDEVDRAAARVTDKQPLNFLLLGLAELMLPHCRVIHCVRDPVDTCVSCFMTNFQQSNAFKYDLGTLGAYYRDYVRLMGHWKRVLRVPILDVRYEEVVRDTEGQVRRMLEFVDLPWDERCLRYYENDRQVKTASVDQVRRPIYGSSVGRWRHYEKHLGPLLAALGDLAPPADAGIAP